MISEDFASGESLIHKMDPRARIIVAGAFSIVAAISHGFDTLVSALVMSFTILLIAKLDLKRVFYRLLAINTLTLILWIFLPFSFEGEKVFTLGPFTATREGILYSALITLKCNAIVLCLIVLVSTIPMFIPTEPMPISWV
jgi:cobalt/nickel transport system permease protein